MARPFITFLLLLAIAGVAIGIKSTAEVYEKLLGAVKSKNADKSMELLAEHFFSEQKGKCALFHYFCQ
jgi:hypothetical protein